MTYDPGSRVTAVKDKMGLTEEYAYDPHGNVVSVTATNGLITRFQYDILDNMIRVIMPSSLTATYRYDVMGNVTQATDTMKRTTKYSYDIEGNMTSLTDASGRTETMTYDIAGRLTSYTSNGGNKISYDYDKLNDLIEKSYEDLRDPEGKEGVVYAYDALGQRVSMMDRSGESRYEYDGLGRITKVTTGSGEVTSYRYDGCDQLAAITYPDGKTVSYEYDKNDNLTKVTDRDGTVTTYEYDPINRVTEIHRPNGVSTYNTYNARDQIVTLKNICDECEWVISQYDYTYDDRGFITGEDVVESLYGYAWDDKHDGKHENWHDELYPHGNKHTGKHDKDGEPNYQIIGTKRTFEYDDDGKLLKATEKEDRQGTYVYTFRYDDMGNRLAYGKTRNGTVQESAEYTYNASNQMIHAKLYDGKKNTTMDYEYDADGNRISETGKVGTDKVELTYIYTVENRLKAIYDADELLVAMAYDGDGNRIFQLNYNLHTDDDWKGNSGNGNGNNKDNSGSGNSGNTSGETGTGSSSGSDTTTNTSTGTANDNNGNATGNTNNTDGSQNQSGILFPIDGEVSELESELIGMIKTTGKEKNYELIEYVNDVNREHTEVLQELNINGIMDTSYTYGNERLTNERFTGEAAYYTYDPRGSVSGLTDSEGMLHQSYRYDPFGGIDFGKPQYNNVYAYNAESYNGNTEHQYLRARYYDTDTADFITEDNYLGQISDPLTLNRYNYVKSSPSNYTDPSGHKTDINIDYDKIWKEILGQQYKSADKAFKQELQSLPGSTTLKNVADFINENAAFLMGATAGVAIFMLTAPASLPVLFLVSEAMVIGGIGGLILGNIDKGISKWKIYQELKKYGIDINASDIYIHQMDQLPPEVQSLCESYNYNSDQQQTYWDATEVLVGLGAIGMSVAQVWEIFGDSLKTAASDFGTNLKSWWNALTGNIYDINKLNNTGNFRNGSLNHILEGDVKRNGSISGYHYEGMPSANTSIVPGTASIPNAQGVYTAQVVGKTGNRGISTFFPRNMTPQQIVDSINEAYSAKVVITGNTYVGTTSSGMIIEMYIDSAGKIISAFPKY